MATFVLNARGASSKLRSSAKRVVPRTSLDPAERENAHRVWVMQLGSKPYVPTLGELLQLFDRLQVPLQPITRQLITTTFEERTEGGSQHFAFADLLLLLEQCKTLHTRWLHKIRGKHFDDDILEAYIAVGGDNDSGGEVDLTQMNRIVTDFNLELPALAAFNAAEAAPKPSKPDASEASGSGANGKETDNALSPRKAEAHMQFSNFVHLLRDGDDALFSNQLYLDEEDLVPEPDDGETPKHGQSMLGGSRRGSMHPAASRRRLSGSHAHFPPLGSQTPKNANHDVSVAEPPPRAHTSLDGAVSPGTSPKNRGSRRAASPPPASRFPVLKLRTKSKKHKFAT